MNTALLLVSLLSPVTDIPPGEVYLAAAGNITRQVSYEQDSISSSPKAGCIRAARARELIRSGRVSVDGETLRRPEVKAAEDAAVFVDGEEVNCSLCRYFMLNKPAGVLSATDDRSQPTVLDLLPREIRALGLFPVGRLDKGHHRAFAAHKRRRLCPQGDLAQARGGEDVPCRHGLSRGRRGRARLPGGDNPADGTHCLPGRLRSLWTAAAAACLCRREIPSGQAYAGRLRQAMHGA